MKLAIDFKPSDLANIARNAARALRGVRSGAVARKRPVIRFGDEEMVLFYIGDHVSARRSANHELEFGTVIAVDGYTYTIKPEDGSAPFQCLQHWLKRTPRSE